MKKLTSATPHEASPTTSTNAPNRDLYSCFTFVTQQTHSNLPAIVVPVFFCPFLSSLSVLGWGGANHFFFWCVLVLPLTDAVQTSKPFAAGG